MEKNPRIDCQKYIDECLAKARMQANAYVRAEVRRQFEQRPNLMSFTVRKGIEYIGGNFSDADEEWWDLNADLEEFLSENRELVDEMKIERTK